MTGVCLSARHCVPSRLLLGARGRRVITLEC